MLGDIIISLNGQKVTNGSDLYKILDRCNVGDKVNSSFISIDLVTCVYAMAYQKEDSYESRLSLLGKHLEKSVFMIKKCSFLRMIKRLTEMRHVLLFWQVMVEVLRGDKKVEVPVTLDARD